MTNKNPPFDINEKIMSDVIEIAELTGRISEKNLHSVNPKLRRKNRIKTIYSSLKIEQNTLEIEQVTDVICGKRVLAPQKDILEVRNAYKAYECIDSLDPYSMDDILKIHQIMTKGLVDEAGEFRQKQVGVVDGKGNVLHFGTLPRYIPKLMEELLNWIKTSDVHMLIKSCVFHYEFELIHPFSDGNGRMGRLWHTLLLSKWNEMFAWLPVESIIHDNQKEYYNAINASNINGNSTVFIEFMLSVIKQALLETMDDRNNIYLKSNTDKRAVLVTEYLDKNKYIKNSDVQKLFNVSSATATRILSGLCKKGLIKKIYIDGHWGYIKG